MRRRLVNTIAAIFQSSSLMRHSPHGPDLHYRLQSDVKTAADARAMIEQLHQYAREAPFADVGKMVELEGTEDWDDDQLPQTVPANGC